MSKKILAVIGTPTREEGFTSKSVHALADSIQEQDYDYQAKINPVANALAGMIERMLNLALGNVSLKPLT